MVGFVDTVIDGVSLALLVYVAFRLWTRRPMTSQAKAEPPASTQVDLAMQELLEKSRASAGRVHIHDVEEVVRRRLS